MRIKLFLRGMFPVLPVLQHVVRIEAEKVSLIKTLPVVQTRSNGEWVFFCLLR